AFDLGQESGPLRDRYGRHKLGQSLLLARRLVEAGVRFINVNDKVTNGQLANWDSHENNFPRLKDDLLPPADQAYSALVEDLGARDPRPDRPAVPAGRGRTGPQALPGKGVTSSVAPSPFGAAAAPGQF